MSLEMRLERGQYAPARELADGRLAQVADLTQGVADKKRANGEGTIYQRKDGRWEGAAFVLTTAGTYRRARVYAQTRDDARKKVMKLIQQSDQGVPSTTSTGHDGDATTKPRPGSPTTSASSRTSRCR